MLSPPPKDRAVWADMRSDSDDDVPCEPSECSAVDAGTVTGRPPDLGKVGSEVTGNTNDTGIPLVNSAKSRRPRRKKQGRPPIGGARPDDHLLGKVINDTAPPSESQRQRDQLGRWGSPSSIVTASAQDATAAAMLSSRDPASLTSPGELQSFCESLMALLSAEAR